MTNLFTLDAEVRTDLGKGASRRLRHDNKVPAIIYGTGEEPVSLTFAHNKVFRAQEEEAFYSNVLTINIDGKPVQALIKDMQRHPFKPLIMHMDFLRVDAKQELQTNVPLHFLNEEVVAKTGAAINHHVNEINITCLPGNLPEFIEVDLAALVAGDTLHLSDVKLPKGVTSSELVKGEEHDQAVVSAVTPKAVKDEDDSADATAEEASAE